VVNRAIRQRDVDDEGVVRVRVGAERGDRRIDQAVPVDVDVSVAGVVVGIECQELAECLRSELVSIGNGGAVLTRYSSLGIRQ